MAAAVSPVLWFTACSIQGLDDKLPRLFLHNPDFHTGLSVPEWFGVRASLSSRKLHSVFHNAYQEKKELITGSNVLFGLDAADPASETDLSYPNTLYPKEIRGLSKDVHLY